MREEGLAERIGWHMTCFGDPQGYPVELGEAPKEVETVVNCRVVSQRHVHRRRQRRGRVQPAALVRRQAVRWKAIPGSEQQRPRNAAKPQAGRPLVVGLTL